MTTEIIIYSILTVCICIAVIYSISRYKRKNPKSLSQSRKTAISSTANLQNLKEECWQQYVALETFRSYKAKCAKAINGDSGLLTANRQLETILSSDNSTDYKAPRIIGQVCDFIINIATANAMLNEAGQIVMPVPSPKLMDKETFFNNIQVSAPKQVAKYETVINHEKEELSAETADQRFVHLLESLLPSLKTISFIAQNEDKLSNEEIVEKAKLYLVESTVIFKRYGY
ncbi:MAG: hypothetical protein K2H47_07350 [Muribaculaceae bacterium]|nr:hypothetical protein [Muribaculaceae bacterium]